MRKYLLGTILSVGVAIGGSGVAHAQAKTAPAPGTLVVHLNGLLDVQMNDIGSSVNSFDGNKVNPLSMAGFLRLYPGFDATTANGLQYGVTAELRTAYTTPNGAGQQEGSSNPGPTSVNVESLVVRRAYMYLGTPQYGFIRAGQTDSPWWLLSTGEYYNWGDHNNWNADGGVGASVPGAAAPSGLFTSSGGLYTTDKVVYLSPKLMGFQAGVSFEPSSNSFKQGQKCTVPAVTCGAIDSSLTTDSATRRRNTVVGAIKYSTEFDAVGATVGAAYLSSTPALPGNGGVYQHMGITEISGEVTYAGFLLGGNMKFGQVNNGYSFVTSGQRDLLFYELTGEYSFGPYRVAAMYFNQQSAGASGTAPGIDRTEADYGMGLGANYDLAKGIELYAMYLYGHRHQLGYNFAAADAGPAHNNMQAQAITIGTALSW